MDASAATQRDWSANIVGALALVSQWLFLLTIAVLPLDVYLTLPTQPTGVFLSQVLAVEAAVALVVTLLVGRLLHRAADFHLAWRDLLPLGFVLAAASLSVIFASSRSVAIKSWLKVLVFFSIYLLARACRDMRGVRRRALLLLLASFFIVLVSGFLGYTRPVLNIPDVLLNIHHTSAAIPFSTVLRAEATFRYPNELAAYLLIALPFLLACIVSYPSGLERSAGAMIFIMGVYLLVITYTRGALVALAITLPFLLFLVAGKRLGKVGVAAVLFGAVLVMLKGGTTGAHLLSVFSLGSDSYSVRFAAWHWAWDAFSHHPLFGVGIGNLSLQPNAPYTNQALGLREVDAENLALNVLAEMGIVGVAAVLYCLVGAFRVAWTARQANGSWVERTWNNGLFVALCGLVIFGIGDPVLVSGQVTGLLCAVVGLAGVLPGTETIVAARQRVLAVRLRALDERIAAAEGATAIQARIVFLINTSRASVAQWQSVQLATELWRRGMAVLVVIPPESPLRSRFDSTGVPWVARDLGIDAGRWHGVLGALALLNPLSRWRALRHLAQLVPDGPTILICPFLREQLLVTARIHRPDTHIMWLVSPAPMGWLHRRLFARRWADLTQWADALVPMSPSGVKEIDALGLPTERLVPMPSAAPARPHMGVPTVEPAVDRVPGLIATISPLTRAQGIHYLIEALPRMRERYPSARLAIAGTGPLESTLRRQVQSLGLEHEVEFLGDLADPQALLRQASIFAYPAVKPDGDIPTIILEAFATGTPVVASAIAGIPDLVVDRRTGLLAWPGDAASIAGTILVMLDHPARAQAMAQAARAMVSDYTASFNEISARFLAPLRAVASRQSAEEVSMTPTAPMRATPAKEDRDV